MVVSFWDEAIFSDYSLVLFFCWRIFFEKLDKFLLAFLWVFISACEGNWSMWPLISRCWAVQHMQLSDHTPWIINLLYDFVYNQLVVNLTDQFIIWLNSLKTRQDFEIRLQHFYSASYCQDRNILVWMWRLHQLLFSSFPLSSFPSFSSPPSLLPPSLSLSPFFSLLSPPLILLPLLFRVKVILVIPRLWSSLRPVTIR